VYKLYKTNSIKIFKIISHLKFYRDDKINNEFLEYLLQETGKFSIIKKHILLYIIIYNQLPMQKRNFKKVSLQRQ